MTAPRTIDLVYFDAGGGHRAAAQALRAVIEEQGRPWQVRLMHLFEVLDPRGRFRQVTGMAPEAYYNKRLAQGWTFGLAQELKLLQSLIRLGHGTMVRALQAHWQRQPADLVVSLVPNFNRALYEGLRAARPSARFGPPTPFVTVMTDLADLPPAFWIEPGQDQHLVCGSARAAEQARAAGYPPGRVHRTSGMILRPDFYRPWTRDRGAERLALGLDPLQPTGVVMFGGEGSRVMLKVARSLPDVPLILLCGRNAALQAALARQAAGHGGAPRIVVGHTPDVVRYLRLGDFFIGKPGPGSLSEALHCGLPVIVTRNAATMPQERYNTDWVLAQGVGAVLPGFGALRPAVERLLHDLPALCANVQRLDNRAVFEVVDLLAGLMQPLTASPLCRETVTAAT